MFKGMFGMISIFRSASAYIRKSINFGSGILQPFYEIDSSMDPYIVKVISVFSSGSHFTLSDQNICLF